MDITIPNIIESIIPSDKDKDIFSFLKAERIVGRYDELLPKYENWIDALNNRIAILFDGHSRIVDKLKVIEGKTPQDLLYGEQKRRNYNIPKPGNDSLFSWAIIITTVIALEGNNNVKKFYAIYKKVFQVLQMYINDTIENFEIERLYPSDVELAKIEWLHPADKSHKKVDGLSFVDKDGNITESHYFILCMTIYIALCCIKITSLDQKEIISNTWRNYIVNYQKQSAKSQQDKKRINNLFDSVFGKLKTNFTRNVDDALGSFPMPQYYQERLYLIQKLQDTAFKESKSLFLTGDRGIGKSLFAKSYALRCAKGDGVRSECQYKHIIWTTYDAAGIYATLSSLACTENVTGDLFENKIGMMKGLSEGGETPCLLVIDNFDFDENEALISELSSDAFAELNKTGWHILFTTKNNLKNINLSVVRQEEISPLSVDELCILFRNLLIANEKFETEKLELLINTYLQKNTYLVSLSAGLCDMLLDRKCETLNDALDYIIQAFEGLKVSQLDEKNLAEKDAKVLTFMEHYKTMFALSDIQSNKDKLTLLYNLALVPLSGVKRSLFFKDAFDEENQNNMQNICDELISSRWIISENKNIALHPMVREIIKESDVQVKSVKKYIKKANGKIHSASFADILKSVESLKSIYQILDDIDWENQPVDSFLEYCQLVGAISTYYDTLHGFSKEAYNFGCRAVELLNQYTSQQQELSNGEKQILAEVYNECGYARKIIHYLKIITT